MRAGAFPVCQTSPAIALQQEGVGMREEENIGADISSLRGIVSAWAVAIFVVVAFFGFQALAALHHAPPHTVHLVGAVIPRHDPICSDGQCRAAPGPFDGFDAEAYATW
jgi:hypothetical protein